MTDDILDRYEDLWRKAALADRQQMLCGPGGTEHRGAGSYGSCAWLHADAALQEEANIFQLYLWACPFDGTMEHALSGVMMHLNNVHRWDWLMFASKFRDILAEGSAKAQL